jgi:hypothetical protein
MTKDSVFRDLLAGLGIAVGVTLGIVYGRYRKDIQKAQERLESDSQILQTACGPIEYGTCGSGYPVLVVHGAGGGYDQGLSLARSFIGKVSIASHRPGSGTSARPYLKMPPSRHRPKPMSACWMP